MNGHGDSGQERWELLLNPNWAGGAAWLNPSRQEGCQHQLTPIYTRRGASSPSSAVRLPLHAGQQASFLLQLFSPTKSVL